MNKISSYLKLMRAKEALFLLGSPFLGLLWTLPDLGTANIVRAILLLVAIFLFFTHVYTFNDWSGFLLDKSDLNKHLRPLVSGKISQREAITLSMCLLVLAAVILFFLSKIIFYLFVFDVVLWIVYAHPAISIKSKPLLPSLIHFIAGIIHFLFGYILFSGIITVNGILIGIFFGLVFSAGHLNHEIKDYSFDKESLLMTSAIKFGKEPMFFTSFVIITLSSLYFYVLTVYKILPESLYMGLFCIYPFYCYCFYQTYKNGRDYNSMRKFRSRYRILYFLAGIYMAVC